jgi:hypothetical protein
MAECQLVTIAMATGARAEEIGRRVAIELRFRYVNEEIIAWAANKASVNAEEIDRVEHSTPLVQRVLDTLARAASVSEAEADAAAAMVLAGAPGWEGYTFNLPAADPSERYRGLIRGVIWETALAGRAVITAHAAGIYLAGREGLLRVFVTGSAESRARRLADEDGLSLDQTRRRIAHSDRERQAYLRRFYDLRQELSVHYDLVVNTDVLSPAAASSAILGAAAAMGKEVVGSSR